MKKIYNSYTHLYRLQTETIEQEPWYYVTRVNVKVEPSLNNQQSVELHIQVIGGILLLNAAL